MNISEYDYDLPVELIAQKPVEIRDKARLMILDIGSDTILHRTFSDLPIFLRKDDLLVINDTKVFPARLIGQKTDTGGEVEVFLLRPREDGLWEALSKPAKRLKTGTIVDFGEGVLLAEIIAKEAEGRVRVRLQSDLPLDEAIDRVGKTPLPPYIKRDPVDFDRERYQTVYARKRGAVAAPTAGLHFTEPLLGSLAYKGVGIAHVTLHVGAGTFRPLTEEEARGGKLHSENCHVPKSTVEQIQQCRVRGSRVIAVGTTTARALETASRRGVIEEFKGWTDIFIKPPYKFRSVDALVTNFHLPRSSLLMMVSAFAGRERVLAAYSEAVRNRYSFYSYGDAMLILGGKQ